MGYWRKPDALGGWQLSGLTVVCFLSPELLVCNHRALTVFCFYPQSFEEKIGNVTLAFELMQDAGKEFLEMSIKENLSK